MLDFGRVAANTVRLRVADYFVRVADDMPGRVAAHIFGLGRYSGSGSVGTVPGKRCGDIRGSAIDGTPGGPGLSTNSQ